MGLPKKESLSKNLEKSEFIRHVLEERQSRPRQQLDQEPKGRCGVEGGQ